jgi:prophage DNA circulation protein
MANEKELIREQMEAKRTELSDKLEKLEKHVVNTVQEATSTVADAVHGAKEVVATVKDTVEGAVEGVKGTVENVTGAVGGAVEGVKETVSGAAQTVRETFDLPRQVERHPWLMIGGAVAVGFAAGKLLDYAPDAMEAVQSAAESSGRFAESITTTAGAAASAAGAWMQGLEKMFGPEINKVKELALGVLLGVARDLAVQSAPQSMSRQVGEIFDSFTSRLGGKPVEGSVLGPRPSEAEGHNGPGRRF